MDSSNINSSNISSYEQELENFKQSFPSIRFLDLVYTDINATPRGKRIPINAAGKLLAGIYLPISTITLNVQGGVIEEAGLGEDLGEPDHLCFPIPGTLKPTFNPEVGQVMLTMMDETGRQTTPYEPRQVLSNLLDQLHDRNIFPVIALELEFYLVDKKRTRQGDIQAPINPSRQSRETGCEVYNIDNLDDYSDFLSELSRAADQQSLNTSGALAESAPGQFEINFNHQQNVLEVCDQAIYMKRLIRQVAHKYGFDATFMAKPFAGEAGNGQHIHLSLVDDQNQNLFSDQQGEPSDLFYQCLTSLLDTAPESMALLCPNVNSFRRFAKGMYTPTHANWGVNHRGVSLRIPMSDSKNRRIEHRIAGADVNPYLLCAVLLAGVLHGKTMTPEHCPEQVAENAPQLPCRLSDALQQLRDDETLSALIGKDFTSLYLTCKESELMEFEQLITPKEVEWMLHSA